MYLSLEVVSPQAASMGAERRRLVGPAGLTIGRLPGNDWVIPDPYISKHHARITFVDDGFLVEGLGRNPIAIGRSDDTVPNNQPRPLKNGDRLFIDQYELIVTVKQGEMPGAVVRTPAVADDDPFSLVEPGSEGDAPGTSAPGPGIPDQWAGIPGSTFFADTATLDPLAVMGAAPAPAPPDVTPVNWEQASILNEQVSLPPVPSSTAASGGIPDNWDRDGLTRAEVACGPAAEPPSPAPPVPPVPPRRPVAEPQRPGAQPRRSPSAPPAAEAAKRGAARSAVLSPARQAPDPNASMPAPPQQPVPAAAGVEFVELLRGAGLTEREMSPETLQELGKALRVVVQGLIEVLQARTEIKSQFRLPLTRVKAVENNPLKLSPNVESALHTLLVQRNPGYLGTVAAFEDAFADVRAHQLAMLEGMRAAFDSMLQSFTPAELEKHFERAVKRGGLLGGLTGRSKYWELYTEHFEELSSDPEDTFRRLFGEVFAEAYEKQLERLKTVTTHSMRS